MPSDDGRMRFLMSFQDVYAEPGADMPKRCVENFPRRDGRKYRSLDGSILARNVNGSRPALRESGPRLT